MQGSKRAAAVGLVLAGIFSSSPAHAQYYGNIVGIQITAYVVAAIIGSLLGFLFSDRLRGIRRYLWWAVSVLVLFFTFVATPPLDRFLTIPVVLVIFCLGLVLGHVDG